MVGFGARPVLKPHVESLPLMVAGWVDPAYPPVEVITADDVAYLVSEAARGGKPSIQLVTNRGKTYSVTGANAFNDAHTNIGWMGEPGYTPSSSFATRPARSCASCIPSTANGCPT